VLPPFDQISTIIHRLEQFFEILNPVGMAAAVEQLMVEIADPLPGNVDGLKALAAAFSAAGRGVGPVSSQLQTIAHNGLPDVWQGDAGVAATVVVSDTGDLVARTGPAFGAVASAIDAYADTLGQLERRRSELWDQLTKASSYGPDVHIFGLAIPIDPVAWQGWLDDVRKLIAGSISLYNDLQNAADTLSAQFADAAAQANAGVAFRAGIGLTDAVVLSAATVDGSSLLSSAQLSRLGQIMATMSAADRARLESAVSAAKSPEEEAYIFKALAAGNSLSQVLTFAGEIRGKPDTWLTNHLSLGGTSGLASFNGNPLIQITQTECGSASVVMARVLTDPIFAYSLTTGANGEDLTAGQFAARTGTIEAQLHNAASKLWPENLGTSPWGVASGMNSGPGGNAGYAVTWVDSTDLRASSAALAHAISAVDAGHPVPVLLGPTLQGLAQGTALHYVLITGHSNGQLSIYDPEGGSITELPDSNFLDGKMQAIDSGAPYVNAVIMPGG
jgi:hypothetical protein